MIIFRYSSEILDDFPGVRGGVVRVSGLSNGPTPPDLASLYQSEQIRAREELGDESLAKIPSISAWRRAFSAFGVKPTRYRNAAEALLRRLTKSGDVPSINLMVDIANLVSIRHRLPVAVFDQQPVTGTTSVRYATGEERFTDLGDDAVSHPEPGEVVFVDDAGLVSARRWCWRQSDQSAARDHTEEALITIEGQHELAEDDVTRAVGEVQELLAHHQPGAVLDAAVLSPSQSEFPPPG